MTGRRIPLALAIACAFALSSCKSGPAPKEESRPLEAAERKAIVDSMTQHLKARYGVWLSPRVQGAVSRLLARVDQGLAVVLLNSDKPICAAGLAGNIYVSKGALRQIVYENELAFLLAREAALARSGALEERLSQAADKGQDLQRLGLLEKDGLYALPHHVHVDADRAAVKTLYSLGYDPRGAVSLLQRWNPLPPSEDRLSAVREEIAKLSPMRDPVINGPLIDELRAALSSKGSGDARRPTVNPGVGRKK